MGYTIGATMAIGSDKEYQRALQGIRQSMSYVKAEAGAVTSAFDKNDNSMEALTARNKALTGALDLQKQAVDEAKAALARLDAQGIDPASEDYQRMTANLNNAQAELNRTANEIKNNEKAMSDLNKEARAEALGKFRDALKGIGDVAGKAVVTGLKATAAAMAAIGTAAVAAAAGVWKIGKDAGNAADDLMTMSAQTGLSVETLQELQYASRFVDVEVDSLAKGMSKTVAAVRDANKAHKDYITVARGVTVATKDAAGATKSTEQIFYDEIDALGKIKNATDQETAAQALFGKSYQELMPLIKAGSGALNKYAEEAKAAGLVLSDEMVSKLGGFDDIMEKTEAQVNGLGKQLAVTFLPALQGVGTGISEFLNVVSSSLADGIQASDITTIGTYLSQKLIDGLKSIAQYIPEIVSLLSNVITQAVTVVVSLLPQVLPILLQGGMQLMTGLLDAITSNTQPLADMIADMIPKLIDFLVAALPQLITAAGQIVIALAKGMIEAIPELIKAIPEIITAIVTALADLIKPLWDAGKNIVEGIWQGIQNAAAEFTAKVKNFFANIVASVKNALGIHSPSTVFAGIGKNMALGIGVGFSDAMAGVSKSIQASMPTVSPNISVTGSGSTAATTAAAPVINIYSHDALSPYEIMREAAAVQRRLAWGL